MSADPRAAQATERFPELVWDAPLLRGLDARAKREIEAAGRVRRVRAGDVLFRDGDPADAIFVVVRGRVALWAVRRGDAEAAALRRASAGEIFGEEATVRAFGVRRTEARCEEAGAVAELPLTVVTRALGRTGGADVADRLVRALRRAATLDLLRTTSFTGALSDGELEVLLDAATHRAVARGEHVFREGDAAEHAFIVAAGLLQAQTDDGGRPRVEAYLGRGDLFGDPELARGEPRAVSVVAAGPAHLVAIPRDVFRVVARRNAGALERARRLVADRQAPHAPGTTAHVLRDVYRMRVARSLLVIDQDACVRCGHCASSCASVHDDGISRLVRQGETITVATPDAREAPLLVPNSCQHCKNPSCMIDCPTGAIGRDARGEVFIREALCTGCGSCAKACPWDNIMIAPRAKKGEAAAFPEVAIKCDLCSGAPAGPACVAACPVSAIARIDPSAALAEVRAIALGRTALGPPLAASAVLPGRARAWPYVLGAGLAAVGLALLPMSPWASGLGLLALTLALVAYAGIKRAPRLLARWARGAEVARPAYVAHLAISACASGLVVAHAAGRASDGVPGALLVTFTLALATGALAALLYAVVPRRLSRVEKKSVLPEDLQARARALDEQRFSLLSGKSEVVKALYARVLGPYARARLGPLALVARGRTLAEEERALRGRALALLGGRKSERLSGLDELVRLVVERRALGAQRILTLALRSVVPAHLAAIAVALVLLATHVVAVTWGGR